MVSLIQTIFGYGALIPLDLLGENVIRIFQDFSLFVRA